MNNEHEDGDADGLGAARGTIFAIALTLGICALIFIVGELIF